MTDERSIEYPQLPEWMNAAEAGLWAANCLMDASKRHGWQPPELGHAMLMLAVYAQSQHRSDEEIIDNVRGILADLRGGQH